MTGRERQRLWMRLPAPARVVGGTPAARAMRCAKLLRLGLVAVVERVGQRVYYRATTEGG